MDLLNEHYSWLWALWALIFVGVEGVAVFNKKPGDTLSEHVWAWLGNTKRGFPQHGGVQVARGVLGLGLTWLMFHFFGGDV